MEHVHNYTLLDVEKRKDTEERYNDVFHRTTRLFCSTCADIKVTRESVSVSIYDKDRPDWTFNIK
jgi:hypothetical protein